MAAELAGIGTKPPIIEIQQIDDPEQWGWYDPVRNVIVVNEKAGMGKKPAFDLSDPVARQRLANLVFHESRHAQQYYEAIRYALLEGLPAIGPDGIHPDLVEAARNHPLQRGAPEVDFGKRAYDEFFGALHDQMLKGQDFERRRFLRDKIEELEAARARAAVELQKLPVLQLRSRREGRWDVARLQRDLVLFQNEL